MLKMVLAFVVVGLSAVVVQAQNPTQHILIDGSVARCHDMSDYGSRAFKVKMIRSENNFLTFRLDNLVCIEQSGKMIHVPYALSSPFVFNKDGRTLSYEYTKANIVVLNTDATALYQTMAINPHVSSQEFVINTPDVKVFDISLQPLEVIKIDGKFFDQGMTFGGSYRITFR